MMQGYCRDTGREHFPWVRVARSRILAILCGWCCLFVTSPGQDAGAQQPWNPGPPPFEPTEPIVAIAIEGNNAIPTAAIMYYVNTRIDEVPTIEQVREDTKAIYNTRWFFCVTPIFRTTDDGSVLVFRVLERPLVRRVEYRGNKNLTAAKLRDLTGLKPGSTYWVKANLEAAKRIEQHYREEGFGFASVKLAKGDDPDDREVVFVIKEGPKVTGIRFRGD